jgi:hypothetical protein
LRHAAAGLAPRLRALARWRWWVQSRPIDERRREKNAH